MEITLITGLDGSGKSTIFSRISQIKNSPVGIIQVPHINLEMLEKNTALFDLANFINQLGNYADKENFPQVKAIALFGSMLLFKDLLKNCSERGFTTVFCERHPLLDTPVYAAFYASKLNPENLPADIISKFDQKETGYFNELTKLLPAEFPPAEHPFTTLCKFIYEWFHVSGKKEIADLEKLFGLKLPNRIFYLRAEPEVLYERLSKRNVLEPHEKLETLTKLDVVYSVCLDAIKKTGQSKVFRIDASLFSKLDQFTNSLLRELSEGDTKLKAFMNNYPVVPGRGLVTPSATKLRLDHLKKEGLDLEQIPRSGLNLKDIQNNIESFVGSVEIPLGIVGPLIYRNENTFEEVFCLAGTLEGALVASMNRGAKAISMCGGFRAEVIHQKMVRCPMFHLSSIEEALIFKRWIAENFLTIKKEAQKHSNHAVLNEINVLLTGKTAHARFVYSTGDAAGQNMTTTCTWHAMLWMIENFRKDKDIDIAQYVIEGNGSSDKKVSAYSVLHGRGAHVIAECFLSENIINKVLRTTSLAIINCYTPSLAATRMDGMSGYNINVANAIAAIFVATGQDLASIHESSTAVLNIEKTENGLYLSLNLPTLVIGTVGGGVNLPKQSEALKLMNCFGSGKSERFAKLIAGFALSLEISTYAAIVSGEFAKAHEKLGRNKPVKWLLRSEINETFIKKHLQYNMDVNSIKEIFVDEVDSIENGIITTITGRASKKLIGFIPVKILLNNNETKNVLIKSKATDTEVINGLHLMAASIDPGLSDLIVKFKENLEYNNCHKKEIIIYEALNRSGYKNIPKFYGAYVNEDKDAYLILQEMLDPAELILFNSENHPELWSPENINKCINAVSEFHLKFENEEERKVFPLIVPFEISSAKSLYEKIISILINDEDSPVLKERLREMYGMLNETGSQKNNLPLTIVHNDFNPRNVAIRKNGKVCIYDWELVALNIPHRDIVEFLSFTLPDGFTKNQFIGHLKYHYSVAGKNIQWETWKKGYLNAVKEYLVTRVSFYKVAGILMKLKFSNRVLNNCFIMINYLKEN